MTAKLGEYMRCGSRVLVRSCSGCGTDRDGSGTFVGTHTCKSKSCSSCAWVRARGIGEGLEKAFDLVEPVANYCWQMAVVSMRWDPSDGDELEVSGLRARACAARRVTKALWTELLKQPGAGMLRTVEVSARGYVHANLIYYGPPMSAREMRVVGKAVDCRVGFINIQKLDTDPTKPNKKRRPVDDPRGSKKALRRAAEYASKGHERTRGAASTEEGWIAGQRSAQVIDPRLAARWEIATYRLHLNERYGALRGLEIEEYALRRKDEVDDHDAACRRCGLVGDWKWRLRPTEDWLMDCHQRGAAGLKSSTRSPRAGPS